MTEYKRKATKVRKAEVDAIWAQNPESVFQVTLRGGTRIRYARIVSKKGSQYVADYIEYDSNRWRSEPTLPEWRMYRRDKMSCKDIYRMYLNTKTLEQLRDELTAEAVAEYHAEEKAKQVKPQAIADLLTLTNLRERDLQATPEAVLLALRDALTVKAGA